MDIISKTINRPITKVLIDLIDMISYKYNENLKLSFLPKINTHICSPSICSNCKDLPF